MPITPEAPAISARLRRLWLGEIARSSELAASDLADAVHEVHLRRVADTLLVLGPMTSETAIPSGARSASAFGPEWSP